MDKLQLIFREYDIRGIAGDNFDEKTIKLYEKTYGKFPGITLNTKTSKQIGKAFGSHLKKQGAKKVIIGFEVRPFAKEIKENFIEGVLDTGINVHDANEMCTPFIYFLTSHLQYDGGIIITGSHNLYFFNGFKLLQNNSKPLFGKELKTLYKKIKNQDFYIDKNRGELKALNNAFEVYKKNILPNFNLKRKIKAVIDCGNGTTGLFAKDFFEKLGVNIVEELYFNQNPNFPNHTPDPEVTKNMNDLIESVKKNKAEVGIAFDADGDRVGFVDEKGNHIPADKILLLMIKEKFQKFKGKKILFDIKCSKLLIDLLPQFGLNPLMHRTGHAPIKDTLRNDPDIILGGELSGHFYFTKNYPKSDDGFFAAATVLEILSNSEKSLSELLSFIPKRIATPEFKLSCLDEHKFKVIESLKEKLSEKYKIIDIDGVRVNFSKTSWGLIRASNTSPYITVRIEAEEKGEVLRIKNIFADHLDSFTEIKENLDRAS